MTQRSPSIRARARARGPQRLCSLNPDTVLRYLLRGGRGDDPTRAVRAARVRRATRRGRADATFRIAPSGTTPTRHIPPQRDHQLARHGDNPNPARPFAFPKAGSIPLRERALRLPPHPIPRELNADRLQPRIARPTNPLLPRPSPRCRTASAQSPSMPPICRRFRKPATPSPRRATPTRSSSRRLSAAPAAAPHSPAPPPSPPACCCRLDLGDLRLESRAAAPPRAPAALARRPAAPRPPNRAPSSTTARAAAPAARHPHVASQPRS